MELTEQPSSLRVVTLMVHTHSHCSEDMMLNEDIFYDYNVGDIVQIYDVERSHDKLILKVNSMPPTTGRLEISLSKVVADALSFKPFSKVVVEKVTEEQATINFVEFVFKRQYLQRGNMWRFKSSMFGKTVHMSQNLSINGMQAQIVQLHNKASPTMSGIINEKTKFVFRSRSARIIWLVQISAEMWEFDQNGNLYFEKFLADFVSPLLDSWRSLGVTHMLTVVFFARTFYLERVNAANHPDLHGKKSLNQTTDGLQYQDHYRIVLENIADIDKVAHIKKLRQEFWAFPKVVDWKIAAAGQPGGGPSGTAPAIPTPVRQVSRGSPTDGSLASSFESVDGVDLNNLHSFSSESIPSATPSSQPATSSSTAGSSRINYAVPSDAVHGNFLEAINTSLNILGKHYMDRDLARTGNAIVMITAGSGVFKVKPNLAQITKQRMVDGGIGLDLISLARPSVHVVPLFLVDCRSEAGGGVKDFYEMPYWIKMSYIDCKKEIAASLEYDELSSSSDRSISDDQQWAQRFSPQPISSLLTAQLVNSADLKTLAQGYAKTMPLALRQLLLETPPLVGSSALVSRAGSSKGFSVPDSPTTGEKQQPGGGGTTAETPQEIPVWGAVTPSHLPPKDKRAVSKHMGGSIPLPILKRDRAESSMAESLSSAYLDEELIAEQIRRGSSSLSLSSRNQSRESLRYSFGDESEKQFDDFEYHRAIRASGSSGGISMDSHSNNMVSISVASSDSASPHSNALFGDLAAPSTSTGNLQPLTRRNSNTGMLSHDTAAELHDLLCDLSTVPMVEASREKLLEMMKKHDGAVFKSAAAVTSCTSSIIPSIVPLGRAVSLSYSSDEMASPDGRRSKSSKATFSLVHPSETVPSKPLPPPLALEPLPPLPPIAESTAEADKQHKSNPSRLGGVGTAKLSPRSAALVARSNLGFDRRKAMMGGGGPPPAGKMPLPPNKPPTGGVGKQQQAEVTKPPGILRQSSDGGSNKPPIRLSSKNFVSKSQFVTTFQSHLPPQQRNTFGNSSNDLKSKSSLASSSPTMSSNTAGGNQEWVIHHGKIIPIAAGKGAGEDKAQYIKEYCDVTCINPFRPKEGLTYMQSITHNRRRWSHVFPSGAFEKYLGHLDYGLNWKSLTQPAILPVSTDYVPSVQALAKGYEIQNFYQLALDRNECPFLTPQALMYEMISQRLSREFQLVEGIDVEPYVQFSRNQAGGTSMSRTVGPSLLTRHHDALSAVAKLEAKAKKSFFILSMGHRIQFLDYDGDKDQVNITQFRSKKGQNNDEESETNTYTYNYELWVPQTNRFQTMTQTFYQFPSPELKWTKIDNIVVGNLPFDGVDDGTRARRLRYTILPEVMSSEEEAQEYFGKIDLLVDFLVKYCAPHETIEIRKDKTILELNEVESLIDGWMATHYADPTLSTPNSPPPVSIVTGPPAGHGAGRGPPGPPSRGTSSKQSSFGVSRGTSSDLMGGGSNSNSSSNLLAKMTGAAIQNPASTTAGAGQGIATPSSPSPRSLSGILPLELWSPGITPPTSAKLMAVNKNAVPHSTISLYQKASTLSNIVKLNIKGNKEYPNWLFFKHDHTAYTFKSFHLEFHWLVCDAWLIDEFITLLYRRCNKWGLRLCQTPEYFSTPNLNVHPFRAQPYIAVPPVANIPVEFCSATRLVERLYFRRSMGWVFDTEQKTDWSSLGLPEPNYAERDRDIYVTTNVKPPVQPSVVKPGPVSSLSKSFQRMEKSSPTPSTDDPNSSPGKALGGGGRSGASPSNNSTAVRQWGSKANNTKDRQYIHHMGLTTVRVAAHGFVWLQNASAKVSDLSLSAEEKRELMMRKMRQLERFSGVATECYDILLGVVATALEVAQEKERQAEMDVIVSQVESQQTLSIKLE